MIWILAKWKAWAEQETFMYQFVESKVVDQYRSYCANILVQLRDRINEEYSINSQFVLIGSGAQNLITQNGDGPFDLDYNLVILQMPEKYWNDLKSLKDTIRNTLNAIVKNTFFSDGKDSTSVITSILHFKNNPDVEFSFDIAILARNDNDNLYRLIHEKGWCNDRFYWNEVPHSHNIKAKADALKKAGLWNDVRGTYLDKKNLYLRRNDKNHPSFIVYVETINELYNRYI